MKKKTASRRLKRPCFHCNCDFKKGNVYYKKREVVYEFGVLLTCEYLVCAKCKYKQKHRKQRFYNFLSKCHHPITREVWGYMPNETVMQPEYTECVICSQHVNGGGK